MPTTLERLIASIDERDALLRELPSAPAGFRNQPKSQRGGPASKTALREVEAVHGPLPKAYRAFLSLHDGWQHFPGHDARANLFSCADFASAQTARFAETFRAWRGNKTNREVQTALVIGGGPGRAFVLLAPAGKRGAGGKRPDTVRSYSERPLSQGDAADFTAFLERTAHLLGVWLERAREMAPVTRPSDAWACVDEGIALFNEPEDNGESVDESRHALHELRQRLDSTTAPLQHALLQRLERELYDGGPFSRARRTKEVLEFFAHARGVWVPAG